MDWGGGCAFRCVCNAGHCLDFLESFRRSPGSSRAFVPLSARDGRGNGSWLSIATALGRVYSCASYSIRVM